jgi:UDP-3-O-[3-hydroxymyristoyl] glucosamine N-acyltransferase
MTRAERPTFKLAEIAQALEGELLGDGDLEVVALRTLEGSGPKDLSFLHQGSYLEAAARSSAAALIVARALLPQSQGLARPLIVVGDSHRAVGRALALFHPALPIPPGVHPSAVIAAGARVDPSAFVGPFAVIGADSRVAAEAVIDAHVVIGRECVVGRGTRLHPNVVLYDRTILGDRVIVHAGTVLGADGFGYATVGGVHHKVPQVGQVIIEDDVEIGANSAIDRATLAETKIGRGTKIDNLVQVGHNVVIGRSAILCGQVGIAGSAVLGDYVVMGGQSGAAGHLEIGTGTQVAAKSAVLQSVPSGRKVAGIPATDLSQWRRQGPLIARLGEFFRRLRRLEKQLDLPLESADTDSSPSH